MYYIYHIPGIKIGVTNNIKRRMREQSFTEWEILEEHTDINIVSIREIELQKKYGLPIDKLSYSESCKRIKKATIAACTASARLKKSNSMKGLINNPNGRSNITTSLKHLEILKKSNYMKRKDIAKEYNISERQVYRILIKKGHLN